MIGIEKTELFVQNLLETQKIEFLEKTELRLTKPSKLHFFLNYITIFFIFYCHGPDLPTNQIEVISPQLNFITNESNLSGLENAF